MGVHRYLLTSLLFLSSACFQVQNSYEGDDIAFSERIPLDLNDPAQAKLQLVRNVFLNSDYNCYGCHVGVGQGSFKGFLSFSNNDWLTKNCGGSGPCVVAGDDYEASNLYKKLNRSDCVYRAGGLCNMPDDPDRVMRDEDVELIIEWIKELENLII
jgi:hypothetical protein